MSLLEEKFWGLVDKRGPDECWEWKGRRSTSRKGKGNYGYFTRKNILAHRLAWFFVNGNIPYGKCILHSCDNPPCCNPAHLRPGTALDNARDRDERGREKWLSGENHLMAKLTWEKVVEIRRRYIPRKVTSTQLGAEYGVHHGTIINIIHRKTWKEDFKNA